MCCICGSPAAGKSAVAIEAIHQARRGKFNATETCEQSWKIVFVDIRRVFTSKEIVDALLHQFKLGGSDNLPQKDLHESERDYLTRAVRAFEYLCIVVDNADLALQPDTREDFIVLLKEIMHAGREEFTLLVTSCCRLDKLFCGDRKIKSVVLKPLDEESACEMLSSELVCNPSCQPDKRDMQMIAREICQGIPELLWHVGKNFENASLSTSERVETLLENPSSYLRGMCRDFGRRHFKTTLESLPSHELAYLHALALFEGPFSEQDGANVVDIGKRSRDFCSKVIDRLDDYSLVLKKENGFRLVKILREYLRSETVPREKDLMLAAKKNYCQMWLKRLICIMKNSYRSNSCRALRQVQAMIKDVKQVLKMMESYSKLSDDLFMRYIAIASSYQSLLRVCLTSVEREEFYSACINESSRRNHAGVQGRLSLRLAEALLDSGDVEGARSRCPKPETHKGVQLRLQYEILQGRIDVEKGNSRKAVDSLTQTLASVSKKDEEFGNVLRVLSDAYCDLADYQNAYSYLSEALTWYRKYFGLECRLNHPDTCVVLFRLGFCLFCQKKYNESFETLSKAIVMQSELHCDHLSIAAALYQLSMCRLAMSGCLNLKAREDLEQVVVFLEGEPSYSTIPLWILAKQAVAKLLTLEGQKLTDSGHPEEGLVLLNKAKEHFANLPDENVEEISSELIKENCQFRRLVDAIRLGGDLTQTNCLNLYCFPVSRGLASPKCADLIEHSSLSRDFYNSFMDNERQCFINSEPSSPAGGAFVFDEPSTTSTPLPVSKHHRRYLSDSSSAEPTPPESPAATPPVHPFPLRSLSSKTDFGIMCCPSYYPSRRLSRCAGSLASFSSFDPDALTASFEDLSTSTDQASTGLAQSSDESGLRMKLSKSDSVPTMS